MTSEQGSIFRLEERIGSGAFSHVYQAYETSTGSVVAVKKSRASLCLRRPLMHYEARILRLLAGHPSIPEIFAYGRFEHFEYLAMELLGHSLSDIFEDEKRLPLKSVLHVADQMISALEHIHSRRIVHRDIKPGNMMSREDDLSVVHLIDFGLARPFILGEPKTYNITEERKTILGTLAYASLNAHHGVDLGPRDDLESLAYTLLYLLRGDLPWLIHCDNHGTVLGRVAQVREKKLAWSGTRLAEGHPPLFGQLVDYARGLQFHEPIDYGRFRDQLINLLQTSSSEADTNSANAREQVKPSRSRSAKVEACPVDVGQLVYVQIISRLSVEGYSMQANDPSFWHDPALSSDVWRTSARPSIVIATDFDTESSLYSIKVVSLGHGTPEKESPWFRSIPVSAPRLPPDIQVETIVPEPAWPMSETYCYAYPKATLFYCTPGQARVPTHWKIGSNDVRLLEEKFADLPHVPYGTPNAYDALQERRRDTWMQQSQRMQFFVKVTALAPVSLEVTCEGEPVDWKGDRAWLDERLKITRRRCRDNGRDWTNLHKGTQPEPGVVADSYFESDQSSWENPQQERGRSLTLNVDQKALSQQIWGECEITNILEVV